MKKIILVLLIILLCNELFSLPYDNVRIYANPFAYDYVLDNIDADHVRSHHLYSMESTDTFYIEYLYKKIFTKENSSPEHKEPGGGVRIVIDFISKSEILSSVIITSSYVFYCNDTNGSGLYSFKVSEEDKCFISECIPFAKYMDNCFSECN